MTVKCIVTTISCRKIILESGCRSPALFFNKLKFECPIYQIFAHISKIKYETVSNETLESLSEKFDQIAEEHSNVLPDDFDVSFSNGVLTAKLGGSYGTYVLNKQTPNLQIWLSSPISGPKRFDFVHDCWMYKRTGEVLHELLGAEVSKLLGQPIDFSKCAYSKSKKS